MKINVDTSEIMNSYKIFDNEIDEFSKNISNLQNEIENISSIWHGQDGITFVTSANEKIIISLNKIKDLLNLYKNDLNVVAQSYDALDEVFLNKSIVDGGK